MSLLPTAWRARVSGPLTLQAEPLGVSPGLIGRPLALPGRRAAAMGIDLLLVALLSGSSRLWLVAGLVVLLAQLLTTRGGVPRQAQPVLGWVGAVIVLLLVAGEVQQRWAEAPASAESAEVAEYAATAASAASEPAARIAQLEQALEQAEERVAAAGRSHGLGHWVAAQADELADVFGWGIVYFSLLPAWWRGQTVGKKLLKLRVLELTGAPLTVLRCLKRYGGYAAGMATGGIGFAQALWDPNRQALHDKAAHTAVFDERGAAAE